MKRSFFLAILLIGCGGGAASTSSEAVDTAGDDDAVVIIEDDDNRVSRSAGEAGGIVVLWPRVMGLGADEASRLQRHLVALAQRTFPDRPLDVRPEPERVCPREGCLGASHGALLVVQNGTCATVAIVGRPGAGELTLLPWSGDLTVRDRNVPFREPPESHVTLREATPCGDLEIELARNDTEVEQALRTVAP